MFHIRVLTAPVALATDVPTAVGELVVDGARSVFPLDLGHWRVEDYQRQWRDGLRRLLHGAPSSLLMSAYRGPHGDAHLMWALWRETTSVYVQPHCVAASDLETAFDLDAAYEHIGVRVPAREQVLPIGEWRVGVEHLFASALQLRWPFA
jgi:hypothetical protein